MIVFKWLSPRTASFSIFCALSILLVVSGQSVGDVGWNNVAPEENSDVAFHVNVGTSMDGTEAVRDDRVQATFDAENVDLFSYNATTKFATFYVSHSDAQLVENNQQYLVLTRPFFFVENNGVSVQLSDWTWGRNRVPYLPASSSSSSSSPSSSASSLPVTALQARFALLKFLNKIAAPLLQYIDVSSSDKSESKLKSHSEFARRARQMLASAPVELALSAASLEHSSHSVTQIIRQLKGLYFMNTKKGILDAILSSLVSNNNPNTGGGFFGGARSSVRISINRIKAAKALETKKPSASSSGSSSSSKQPDSKDPQKSDGKSRDVSKDSSKDRDPDGLLSIFGQMFTQLRNHRYESVFRGQRDAQLWSAEFVGEGSIDVGGPFRESISNLCSDLMSDATPLFIRVPNARNSVGLNREKWIPNPSAVSALHLSMYEFVGALMGMSLFIKFPLSLDLPSMVWKQVLASPVDKADLEAIDKLCVQALNELSSLPRSAFDSFSEKFTTHLSDNSECELKRGGRGQAVTFDNRVEFVRLAIEKRLGESKQQMESIRKGLVQVVPAPLLSLLSWFDLEVMVCGNPAIDVDMLRRHTRYSSGLDSSSAVVKYLFDALTSFTQEERQMFLRFVWGRSRLPTSDSDWTTSFTINLLSNAKDESLPISHTCFFSIDLPPYSSYEILRAKLLYAIYNCTAIDVDFSPNNASNLTAWVD